MMTVGLFIGISSFFSKWFM